MIPAPIPEKEKERLADLRAMNLLDTPPEERFDRIVRLVREMFDVPITYIALVDSDRQWFKAKCGIELNQTGRRESFCGHTILQSEPLIIPDALNDERFYDNPMVLDDPKVRFYAGHPLASEGGYNVATLCVVDTRPRELTEKQLILFRQVAEIAQDELNLVELIRTQHELLKTKKQLEETQKKLAHELSEAAAYVESMLPEPLESGGMSSGYRFISSSQLGGDNFGYDYLDEAKTKLAIYLLDVTGHGVGSSLLSVTVGNVLSRHTLPGADFHNPASVLAALNNAFPMDQNHGKFFTMWYGVYDILTHELTYSSAGHHPAVLYPPNRDQTIHLGEPALMIGAMPDVTYENFHHTVEPGTLMYLFSDGAFEVHNPQGDMLRLDGLHAILNNACRSVHPTSRDDCPDTHNQRLDHIVQSIRRHQGNFNFPDDFSMLEVAFH